MDAPDVGAPVVDDTLVLPVAAERDHEQVAAHPGPVRRREAVMLHDGRVDVVVAVVAHLAAWASAARRGAPLAGYFAWSLPDNIEWGSGYEKRFDLVHIDYATQRRTIKGTGHRYAGVVRAHRGQARRAA
ncbi:hypothetical protein GCM10010309_07560 [Streptomyces violaceochromogenes]|nr:hypothetical protein GCM10010309_07560 [Streptomyces violaceochromogenes]